jgi:hypothetical protein
MGRDFGPKPTQRQFMDAAKMVLAQAQAWVAESLDDQTAQARTATMDTLFVTLVKVPGNPSLKLTPTDDPIKY